MVGQHRSDIAEHPRIEDLADDVELGQEDRPQRLHAQHPGLARRIGDPTSLRGVETERLLHDGGLPGLKTEQSHR
jgi:hypothetical protein